MDSPPRVNPHDFSGRRYCSACHTTPPALKFDSVTTCTRCHTGYLENHPVVNHPLAEVPHIQIGRKMPLDRDRRMVCYTCHDQHGTSRYEFMLRVDFDRLCATCHRGY